SEKALKEYQNADPNLKSELEKEIQEAKNIMNSEDISLINRQVDRLQMALSKFSSSAYAATGAAAGATASSTEGQSTSENTQQNYKIED
ncbi:MAG: hypothetical protein QXI58_08770, partial [Candidatus Micrarchaeia archaeon]